MVLFRDWIFEEALYKQEALRFDLDYPTRERASRALGRLERAWKQGRLGSAGTIPITENKAVQAFNKLVFQEMLGHTDLLFDGSSYSILPEVTFSGTERGRPLKGRADLSIGDFSVSRHAVVGVTELKSPAPTSTSPSRETGTRATSRAARCRRSSRQSRR